MKTSSIIVATTAALVSAQAPPEGTNKISCAKPNANYCYGGDIIIRCDANAIGTAGRCSDNVHGYPPLGGLAECFESAKEAGDAACQKNCVVYAQPSFTLPASECKPSYTATPTGPPSTYYPPPPPSSTYVPPGQTNYPPPPGHSTSTPVYTIPEGTTTHPGSYPPPPPVTYTTPPVVTYTTTVVNGTTVTVPCTTTTPAGPTYSIPEGTTLTYTGPPTVPSNAAGTNGVAMGALALAGFVAVYLI
ncbi:hypothetical protein PT974_11192 [Cladobotryum mycophilum]|uniref:Uncharacterized protein n=1 Tax=Cladobotryum mycophilum TaxID=491253 RepID=A0ABR0S4J0_9HYPO